MQGSVLYPRARSLPPATQPQPRERRHPCRPYSHARALSKRAKPAWARLRIADGTLTLVPLVLSSPSCAQFLRDARAHCLVHPSSALKSPEPACICHESARSRLANLFHTHARTRPPRRSTKHFELRRRSSRHAVRRAQLKQSLCLYKHARGVCTSLVRRVACQESLVWMLTFSLQLLILRDFAT